MNVWVVITRIAIVCAVAGIPIYTLIAWACGGVEATISEQMRLLNRESNNVLAGASAVLMAMLWYHLFGGRCQ